MTQRRLAPGARRPTRALAAARGGEEAHGAARGGASPGRKERADTGTLGGNMPNFLLALQTHSGAAEARARVREQDLRQWGLTGQWPRAEVSRGPSAMRTVLGALYLPTSRPVLPATAEGPSGEEPAWRRVAIAHLPRSARRGRTRGEWHCGHLACGPGEGEMARPCPKKHLSGMKRRTPWCLKGVGLQT